MTTTKWVIDPTHAEIQFKIKHLMISNVTGSFTAFDGTIETNGKDLTSVKASFSADVDSISTNNAQRDAHLKANDFFDSATHPKLTFVSSNMEQVDEENYLLKGI